MTNKTISKILCLTLAAAFVTTLNTEPVFAAKKKRKTLLEHLFPKAAERARLKRLKQQKRLSGARNPVVVVAKPKRPKIKKVQAPSYYNYKPESFAKVSSKSIIAALIANQAMLEKQKLEAQKQIEKLQNHPVIELIPSEIDRTSTGLVQNESRLLDHDALSRLNITTEKNIARAIQKHYAKNPNHIWLDENYEPTSNAKAALYVLKRANAYGLNADHYQLQSIGDMILNGTSFADAVLNFEMNLTANVLRYMADAKDGVINPNKISGYHDFKSYNRRYEKHLENVIAASHPAKAMLLSHPNNQQFTSLKMELQSLEKKKQNEIVLEPVKSGTFIRPEQSNAELPKIIKAISVRGSKELKDKHQLTFSTYTGSEKYEKPLVELVKDFQAEKKLKPDGIIGKNTLFRLVGDNSENNIKRVKLAMERLRWLPVNLGYRHVFINQPAYNASYMVNNTAQLSMRAIVGKLSNQTNFFHDTIETVEFNPYWNVPRSILVNEKLSKLQANPYHYQNRGFEILKHGGRVIDPGSVNWYDGKSTKKYYVRQKPGGRNALGELKILFPNKHNIYMHDTPSRGLFKRSSRALSHGCIRLHKPREMAAAVMGTSVGKVSSYISSGKNKAFRVPKKLPVYVSYFTAWPNSSGTVKYFPDIYGRDKALEKALTKTDKSRISAITS